MSFIETGTTRGFNAGWFLAEDEQCVRVTKTIPQNHAQVVTTEKGQKIVPCGAIFPANGATAVGILYEDIDVTKGAAPGSVVVEGRVYKDRLPAAPVAAAESAMSGITFVASVPTVTRPY